jgi:hypothetical protein
MSEFCAINAALPAAAHHHQQPVPADDDAIPIIPRPSVSPISAVDHTREEHSASSSSCKTPTRESFAGIVGQKALPELPVSATSDSPDPDSKMGESDDQSQVADTPNGAHDAAEDIEMTDCKDASDEHESLDDDSGRPSKKKKGQRFFCTDFPPCALSFTRSEHLARHIR